MFKDNTPTPLNKDNFGVGSIFGFDKRFLVVTTGENKVGIVNLEDFVLQYNCEVHVQDVNWLTKKETIELVNAAYECATFGENTFDTKGLKQ